MSKRGSYIGGHISRVMSGRATPGITSTGRTKNFKRPAESYLAQQARLYRERQETREPVLIPREPPGTAEKQEATMRMDELMTIESIVESVAAGHMTVERAVEIVAARPIAERRAARGMLSDLIAGCWSPRPGVSAADLLRRLD